jgi:predicted lipoprotein with Yx(FWY)xxD motif
MLWPLARPIPKQKKRALYQCCEISKNYCNKTQAATLCIVWGVFNADGKVINVKKSSLVAIIIVVLVIAGGAFAIFHKSNKQATSNTATSNSSTQAAAATNAVLATKTSSSLGQYLAEVNGQALYTYGSDTSGVSNCTGSCLASWPAYQDKGSTTGLPSGVGTIKRTDDGEIQYTYNGMPLYTFVGDTNGQVTGNGVSNFTVAKPAATSASSNKPASTSASTTTSSNSGSSSW